MGELRHTTLKRNVGIGIQISSFIFKTKTTGGKPRINFSDECYSRWRMQIDRINYYILLGEDVWKGVSIIPKR